LKSKTKDKQLSGTLQYTFTKKHLKYKYFHR